MKKLLSLLLALALCAGLSVPALAAEFSDVPAGHSFYSAIADCSAKGIVGGYSDGTFQPGRTVTRSNFCVMLSRAFYAEEAAKNNTKVYLDMGAFVPGTRALFDNGILENTSFISGFAAGEVMNLPISRYDMAQLMTNIMTSKGFAAASSDKITAVSQIADYSSIPAQYQDAVANVYALGIIGGFADGTFGGTVTMNRGQAAVVIYRMMQYSGNSGTEMPVPIPEAPAAPTPSEPGVPNTPSTPSQTEKTLTNGKPVTEANILELLNELKSKYPEGTDFASGYYPTSPSTDVRGAIHSYQRSRGGGRTSINTGCGGWATLVSDYIFGQTGFPARQVSLNDARPGDIGISLDTNGRLTHVFIVIGHAYRPEGSESTMIASTDANNNGDNLIYWGRTKGQWDDGYGGTLAIWTRCPE